MKIEMHDKVLLEPVRQYTVKCLAMGAIESYSAKCLKLPQTIQRIQNYCITLPPEI